MKSWVQLYVIKTGHVNWEIREQIFVQPSINHHSSLQKKRFTIFFKKNLAGSGWVGISTGAKKQTENILILYSLSMC